VGGECYGYGFDEEGAGDFWEACVGEFSFSFSFRATRNEADMD